MNFRLFSGLATVLAMCSSFVSVSWCFAQPPTVSGFEISWFDEFDDQSLDLEKWTPQFSIEPTNNSLHAYLPDNVVEAAGNLLIISNNQGFGQFDYTSGQVISTALNRYGRFEVRGKLPTSAGMWPAIWLLPDSPPLWPSQGEIDIMENRGNEPFVTSSAFHFGTNPPFAHFFVYDEFEAVKNGTPINFHDSFHTYAAEWDPQQIRYYVDGIHYYTVRDNSVQNFLTTNQTNPMRLIINTAIGGAFLPNPNASTQWPQFFEVDYAYVYDRVGEPILKLDNGDFEANSGSLAKWSLFGSNGANISSDNAHSQSANNSLKMFGQFAGNENFSGIEQGVSVQPGDVLRLRASAFIDSLDPISKTANQVVLKFDYYNKNYGAFGSSEYISSQSILLADASTAVDQWVDRELFSVAPNNAVEARAAIVFRQVNNGAGSVFVDDVEFTNLTASESLLVDNFYVGSGVIQSGMTGELETSDDSYLEVLTGKSTTKNAPIELVLESGPTEIKAPSSIRFAIEVAGNTPNLQIEILAFNYETSQFDSMSSHLIGTTDTILETDYSDTPAAYLNENNQLLVQLNFSASGPTLFNPWTITVDQVQWVAEQ